MTVAVAIGPLLAAAEQVVEGRFELTSIGQAR